MKHDLSAFRAMPMVLLIAALGLAACDQKEAESAAPAPDQQAVAVQVITVASHQISGEVRASGLVAYKREAALSFGAPGELEEIHADVGDRVARGQVLATLRRTGTGADAAEAEIAARNAEQNLERATRLQASGAISDVDLDNARLAVERTRMHVSITAPRSGVVLRRNAERGQVVNPGEPVLWIGEATGGVIVRAAVTAAEADRLSAGAKSNVMVRGREVLTGSIARISPASVGAAGVFEVEVAIDAPGDLRSGEVAEVAMVGREDETGTGAFHIPALSLIDARADQGVVYVIDGDNIARRRPVETGGVDTEGVVILAGLLPGDRVVARGAAMIRDGDPVQIVGE